MCVLCVVYGFFFLFQKIFSLPHIVFSPTQVCVAHCPTENYSLLGMARSGGQEEGVIKEKMFPYCSPHLSLEVLQRSDVASLVRQGLCPPWWV